MEYFKTLTRKVKKPTTSASTLVPTATAASTAGVVSDSGVADVDLAGFGAKSFSVTPGKELEYYEKNYIIQHVKSSNKNDLDLDAKPLSDDDRICDILLLMDCTGSMGSWIELCKRTLCDCIDAIVAQHKELDIRVAFVGYRDFSDRNIFDIIDFTLDTQAVKGFISKQQASGGDDAPEDVQGGLMQGLNLNWRSNSIKMCYLCADAPGHGKQYHDGSSDTYPSGSPVGIELETLIQEYSNREIDLTVYCLDSSTNKMYQVMEQAYNQGANAKQFKRIFLQQDIQQAQAKGESLTAAGGHMEASYFKATSADMASRGAVHYAKKGW